MADTINIKLRSEVLNMALSLESSINQLLILYLRIEKEELRTLGNKSTSISFKNKIDLLTDLGVIAKEENKMFELFMQLRNQFLHNIECSSFEIALQHLGSGSKNQLLKYRDESLGIESEFVYTDAFRQLNLACLDCIIGKIKLKGKLIEEKLAYLKSYIEYSLFIIDQDNDLFKTIIDQCAHSDSDSEELQLFKGNLIEFITNSILSVQESEGYKSATNSMNAILEDEELFAKFFK